MCEGWTTKQRNGQSIGQSIHTYSFSRANCPSSCSATSNCQDSDFQRFCRWQTRAAGRVSGTGEGPASVDVCKGCGPPSELSVSAWQTHKSSWKSSRCPSCLAMATCTEGCTRLRQPHHGREWKSRRWVTRRASCQSGRLPSLRSPPHQHPGPAQSWQSTQLSRVHHRRQRRSRW